MTLPFSACALGGLPYQRASDPWVSFGPDGTAYASALSFDGSDGALYVVWENSTNFGKNVNQDTSSWDNQIVISVSRNGGATWTTPSVVHHLASGLPVWTPMVAVAQDGTVAVSYYDNRELSSTNTTTLPTDYWVSTSADGGAMFGHEQHIAGPFDEMSAPVAGGFFLGDYEGLQGTPSGFEAFFVKTNCNLDPAAPNAPPSGNPACGPASSNLAATPGHARRRGTSPSGAGRTLRCRVRGAGRVLCPGGDLVPAVGPAGQVRGRAVAAGSDRARAGDL